MSRDVRNQNKQTTKPQQEEVKQIDNLSEEKELGATVLTEEPPKKTETLSPTEESIQNKDTVVLKENFLDTYHKRKRY